eukprot:TRINITY_DN15027_c0_g2_i1.p1 TRINITY_DN15027_c0_g2~~TRINITY_DN15027_c0_g2_i1.p1  ORF type:complete len:364 (+),score=-11.90 TRINITY_DN15027_c0_g2_i1:91-1092(+)
MAPRTPPALSPLPATLFPAALVAAASLLLLLCATPRPARAYNDMSTARYAVKPKECVDDPSIRKARLGSGVDEAAALCLKSSSSLTTDFDNANRFFIGSMDNVASFGALCVPILQTLAVTDDNTSLYETPLPSFFVRQGFALNIWGPPPSSVAETVIMTFKNEGVTSLSMDGVDFAAAGLPPDFEVLPGQTRTVTFDRSAVTITFDSIPLLQSYLAAGSAPDIEEGDVGAVIIVKMYQDDPSGLVGRASYVFIRPTGNTRSPYQFYLFEANYYLPVATGRRRLLATIPPKTTTPPSGSQKGCCNKATPPPPCRSGPGGVNYPACRNPVCKTPC